MQIQFAAIFSKGFSKNVYYECLKIYYILNIFP